MITKPDLGGFSHPARFSPEIIQCLRRHLGGYDPILDSFAGTGRIHILGDYGHETWGTEIEHEWASLHPRTIVANALHLPFANGTFGGIGTSPTYANRFADHHRARDGSVRRSYTHDLGRTLHPDNSGAMQWGPAYRKFHEKVWRESARVLWPGGRLVLNIKNHPRGRKEQPVVEWHRATLEGLGFVCVASEALPTRHLRQGENPERSGAEMVLVFDWLDR